MMSLSLSWTCQRDRVSLLVKFELKKKKNFNTVLTWKIMRVSEVSIFLYNNNNNNNNNNNKMTCR